MIYICSLFFFFFQAEDGIRDLIVTGIQTCALPISEFTAGVQYAHYLRRQRNQEQKREHDARQVNCKLKLARNRGDRKSTRLNSSHDQISYAVFCLKKKKNKTSTMNQQQS